MQIAATNLIFRLSYKIHHFDFFILSYLYQYYYTI